MRTSRKLAATVALAGCAAVSALAPALASADTYAPGANAQNFQTGVGGWTGSTTNDGLCLPPLTCPIITNSFQASGGVGGAGDGFIRSGALAIAQAATTTNATWTSNTFTYNGNGGVQPANVLFDMFRNSNVDGLVSVGDSVNYTVTLHNTSNNTDVTVVPQTTLSDTADWTAIPTASVNPSLLVVGHNYQIRVTTQFVAVANALLVGGESDWDNIVVTTVGDASGGGGGGGTGGSGTGGSGTGSGSGSGSASGQNPYGSAAAVQACINNAKKKVKKIKNKAKRKKKLKKKIANCQGKKVVKKKKKGKKRKK